MAYADAWMAAVLGERRGAVQTGQGMQELHWPRGCCRQLRPRLSFVTCSRKAGLYGRVRHA